MRFVGERKACAAAVLAFFAMFFLLLALAVPAQLLPMLLALGGAYLIGFFGVVAGWFWARWYAMGLGFSGLVLSALMAWQVGFETFVLFYGGTHLAIILALLGQGPASAFDARKDWRERYRMDDNAANRLGKAIMRAGASLPYLILAGLAPREEGLSMALGFTAVALGAFGLRAIVKLRTWGVLALGGAAVALAGAAGGMDASVTTGRNPAILLLGVMLLLAAIEPFVGPMVRALRRR